MTAKRAADVCKSHSEGTAALGMAAHDRLYQGAVFEALNRAETHSKLGGRSKLSFFGALLEIEETSILSSIIS